MGSNIAYEALDTLKEYIPRLIDGIEKITVHFSQQREGDGFGLMVHLLEGLEWAMAVVDKTQDTLRMHGLDLEHEQIRRLFLELVKAVENEDYVLISDVLEYEIAEVLAAWQNELAKIDFAKYMEVI